MHDASPPSPEVCDMDYLRWSKFDLEVPRWYSTLFGYVLVVTTRDMGILALREPGPRLGGRGENEGNQDSDEVGVQSHKPLVEMGLAAQVKTMILKPMGHFPYSEANIVVDPQHVDVLVCG